MNELLFAVVLMVGIVGVKCGTGAVDALVGGASGRRCCNATSSRRTTRDTRRVVKNASE
jgi:hypothetical protein